MAQPQRDPIADRERYLRTAHYIALLSVIASPILVLLPPRKLDFYTFGLVGLTGYSADYLVTESTGRSIWQNFIQSQQQAVAREAQKDAARQTRAGETSMVGELQKETRSVVEEMRREREVWKAQRQREIREEVEAGKGYGEMIMDQVHEVFSQARPKKEDEEEK